MNMFQIAKKTLLYFGILIGILLSTFVYKHTIHNDNLPFKLHTSSYNTSLVPPPRTPTDTSSLPPEIEKKLIAKSSAQARLFNLPLAFEKNEGQIQEESVKFLSRSKGIQWFFQDNSILLALRNNENTQSNYLKIQFVEANPNPTIKGIDELQAKTNYIIGQDESKWRTHISNYGKVLYENLYPNINAVFYGNNHEFEYDLQVVNGADYRTAKLQFEGAEELSLDLEGNLCIHLGDNQEIKMNKPFIYQWLNEQKVPVDGRYVLLAKNEVGFSVDQYDTTQTLIIDPTLSYSTYLGGTGEDHAFGIDVDADGNAYVVGSTASIDFPTTGGVYQQFPPGGAIVFFISKLSPDGATLIYSTYFGGTTGSSVSSGSFGIKVDDDGNVYMAGNTGSSTVPVTANAIQMTNSGGFNAIVAKFNFDLSQLLYSTYLGSIPTATTFATCIDIDSLKNIYVGGRTTGVNFPDVPNSSLFPCPAVSTNTIGFVLCIDTSQAGQAGILYKNLLGGTIPFAVIGVAQSGVSGIALDDDQNVYATGFTTTSDFPITSNAFQTTVSDVQGTAFVAKFRAGELLYSSFLGGTGSLMPSGASQAFGIAIDDQGNPYVTGQTNNPSFNITPGAYQTTFTGIQSTFLTKIDDTGPSISYSTFINGSGSSVGNSIAVANGYAYITGITNTSDFPTVNSISPNTGQNFVTQFNQNGTGLIFSTLFGTNIFTVGRPKIALDPSQNIYIAGSTVNGLTVTPGAFQTFYGGGASDGFVAKITGDIPTVTSVTPSSGFSPGGILVTITGSGFTTFPSDPVNVFFGNAQATGVTVIDDNTITAIVPAGTAGDVVDVTVVTAAGPSLPNPPFDHFTYIAAPTVTGVIPNSGPATGGTAVTITGTNFTGATQVAFGSTSVGFTVVNDNQITAISPAQTQPSPVDVIVTTPSGISTINPADEFFYSPTVTAVSPSSGPTTGGNIVEITGTNFDNTSVVRFGVNMATILTLTPTQIFVTAPAGALGNVDVTVTTNAGTSATSAADQYTYTTAVPPTVTGISPTSGPEAGGTVVTITGSNFTGATNVFFGLTAAASFTVNNDTQITATSPPGVGVVDVTVTNNFGTSATSPADQFTYIAPAPTVTGVTPNQGPAVGGTLVVITGTNLTPITQVNFGPNIVTTIISASDTSIAVLSPPGVPGTVDVTVTTPSGTSATNPADQYTYILAIPPTVTGISPTSGPEAGGTVVTITGSNFTGATNVFFGVNAAAGFVVNNDTQITATSPPGVGVVDVTVTNSFGTSATSPADQFTYIPPAPTVTGVNPNQGPAAGGTLVVITGTNFANATQVNFGPNLATILEVSDNIIVVLAPPGVPGTVDVTVTTPSGTSATNPADQYTYNTISSAPVVTGISPTSGPEVGGTVVTISGANFTGATQVYFGVTPASSFTINNDGQITAISPPGVGIVDVTVTNIFGISPTSPADQFTYITPPPVVTSISPTQGLTTGGTLVVITGSNLIPVTQVNFGSNPATIISACDTTLVVESPPGAPGTVDVTVTTPSGTSPIVLADKFTYVTTLTDIFPPSFAFGEFIKRCVDRPEFIILRWKRPEQGLIPVFYRIYGDSALTQLIAVVPDTADSLSYKIFNLPHQRYYRYWIVSVDAQGDVSEPAVVVVYRH